MKYNPWPFALWKVKSVCKKEKEKRAAKKSN
jgi:hypothetical protein